MRTQKLSSIVFLLGLMGLSIVLQSSILLADSEPCRRLKKAIESRGNMLEAAQKKQSSYQSRIDAFHTLLDSKDGKARDEASQRFDQLETLLSKFSNTIQIGITDSLRRHLFLAMVGNGLGGAQSLPLPNPPAENTLDPVSYNDWLLSSPTDSVTFAEDFETTDAGDANVEALLKSYIYNRLGDRPSDGRSATKFDIAKQQIVSSFKSKIAVLRDKFNALVEARAVSHSCFAFRDASQKLFTKNSDLNTPVDIASSEVTDLSIDAEYCFGGGFKRFTKLLSGQNALITKINAISANYEQAVALLNSQPRCN